MKFMGLNVELKCSAKDTAKDKKGKELAKFVAKAKKAKTLPEPPAETKGGSGGADAAAKGELEGADDKKKKKDDDKYGKAGLPMQALGVKSQKHKVRKVR